MSRLFLPGLLLALSLSPAMAAEDATEKTVITNAVDRYIVPGYRDFHADAHALAEATEAFCKEPGVPAFDVVRARFGDAVDGWSRVELIQAGPVMEKNRFERVLFYPDRKSTGLKQVEALIEKKDESATDPVRLFDKSVAVQGLGAYEVIFFGAYPEGLMAEKNGFRCRYGLAVARNVERIAADIEAEWTKPGGTRDVWVAPSKDNPVYRTGAEAMTALIGIHVHGLETVRDTRIKQFYKGKGMKVTPRGALFWRSANTMRALAGNVDGLRHLWKEAGMEQLLEADSRSLSDSVMFDYKSAFDALGRIEQPTKERLGDPKYLAKLDFVEFTLKDAITRIDTDIGMAIGLGAGFSFSDGD